MDTMRNFDTLFHVVILISRRTFIFTKLNLYSTEKYIYICCNWNCNDFTIECHVPKNKIKAIEKMTFQDVMIYDLDLGVDPLPSTTTVWLHSTAKQKLSFSVYIKNQKYGCDLITSSIICWLYDPLHVKH